MTWSAGGGELSGFTVSREGGQEKQFDVNDLKKHQFTGLKPGTKYTIVVLSKSGDQTSAAMTRDFHTCKYHEDSRPNQAVEGLHVCAHIHVFSLAK